jgi:hypothetical protein
MIDLIQEIRLRRAEARARQVRGEGMADGWTEQHIDALLAEIDRLSVPPGVDVMERAAAFRIHHLDPWLRDYSITPVAEYERQFDKMLARALTEYGEQRVTEAIAMTTSLERIEAYGNRMVEETINRAAALVPPEMQQWFVDEMHGVKRVGGEVVG